MKWEESTHEERRERLAKAFLNLSDRWGERYQLLKEFEETHFKTKEEEVTE